MRLLVPVLVVLALAGCSAPAPMPVPTAPPTPTTSPLSMLPMPGTDFLLDQVGTFEGDDRVPTVRFAAAEVAGQHDDVEFELAEGTWLLRVTCATDASGSVTVSLAFADGRKGVEYEAFCGETPPDRIVSVTSQSPEFPAGGAVRMRLQSDSRFVAAAGLVPAG